MKKNISIPEKRNVILNGKRTTLRLERYIWHNLDRIAEKTNQSIQDILNHIWHAKEDMPMAPSVRLFLMLFFTHYAERFNRIYEKQSAIHHENPNADYPASSAIHAAEPLPDDAAQSYEHALLTLEVVAIS